MSSPLSFLFWRDVRRTAGAAEPDASLGVGELAAIEPPPKARARSAPLDGIGQRNEVLRVRIAEMSERLGELRTLTDDFGLLIDPIEEIADELPRAKARNLELEALLAQEVDGAQALRREVDELLGRYSAASSELSTASARTARLEGMLREQEAAFDEQRLTLREKTTHANALERQLLAEAEQNQSFALEIKTLRAESQVSDQSLSDAERMLADLGEQRQILEQENRRLHSLAEDQAGEILTQSSRIEELTQKSDSQAQSISILETQLAAEQAARQRSVTQAESEIAALKTERSGFSMKIETLSARLAATDQILVQVRNQLREREEAVRAAERANKEAIAERSTFERRIESVRADAQRASTQLADTIKSRAEFEARTEMLAKALAAKDAALEGVTTRANNLADRVEALTQRFEQDRLALEAVNRRLIEELQTEKAERTLAQGALDIARESRAALQRQNESLKRASRSWQGDAAAAAAAAEPMAEPTREERSNVRFFNAPDKTD